MGTRADQRYRIHLYYSRVRPGAVGRARAEAFRLHLRPPRSQVARDEKPGRGPLCVDLPRLLQGPGPIRSGAVLHPAETDAGRRPS